MLLQCSVHQVPFRNPVSRTVVSFNFSSGTLKPCSIHSVCQPNGGKNNLNMTSNSCKAQSDTGVVNNCNCANTQVLKYDVVLKNDLNSLGLLFLNHLFSERGQKVQAFESGLVKCAKSMIITST